MIPKKIPLEERITNAKYYLPSDIQSVIGKMYRISDIPLQDLFANSPQIYKELKNLIFIDEGKKTTYIDAVRQIDSLLASSDSKKRKYGEAAMAYLASPFVQIYNKYYSRKDNPANE